MLATGGTDTTVMTQSARVHEILCSKCGYQVNCIRGHALAEDLGPGMRLNLRELELCVVGVHGVDLLPSGGTQDLDDLHQLIYPALTYKSRPPISVTRHWCAHQPSLGNGAPGKQDLHHAHAHGSAVPSNEN